jgi:ketosteroid isomerase-like protein
MADIVERYLDAIVSHDWDAVAECVADDIVRVGPFRDRYDGRDDYLAFIADSMKAQGLCDEGPPSDLREQRARVRRAQ